MASPAGDLLTQRPCAPIKTHTCTFPSLCSLLPSAPLGGKQMAVFLELIQTHIFLNFGTWDLHVWWLEVFCFLFFF